MCFYFLGGKNSAEENKVSVSHLEPFSEVTLQLYNAAGSQRF